MNNIPIQDSSPQSKRDEEIHAVLVLLEGKMRELKNDVEVSKELLLQGVKTNLAADIEKKIEDPLSNLTGIRNKIDKTIKGVIEAFINKVLSGEDHRDLIDSIYKTSTIDNEILFIIVLKNDTIENREELFGILDFYDTLDFSSDFPVNFEFVPLELKNKITKAEVIPL